MLKRQSKSGLFNRFKPNKTPYKLKRIFVFSYHGKETFQTSYYRLLNLAEHLSSKYEVYFVHGALKKVVAPIEVENNLIKIPLNYRNSFIQHIYASLLSKKKKSLAKLLVIFHYFLTGREIFDLGKEFRCYLDKTNLQLTKDDIVLVSFPSLAIHNLGFMLKKEFGCKLIMDYRDPGVFGYKLIGEGKFVSAIRKFFLKKRELRNFKNADLVVTISESIKNFFPNNLKKNIQIIRNGYVKSKVDFDKIDHNEDTFILLYLGTVYDIQLNDKHFFEAVRLFIDKNNVLPHQFLIKFIGANGIPKLKHAIHQYKLEPYIISTPRIAIEEAYNELYKASMFLHLRYGNIKEIISSKQYEYLAFQKPILLPVSDNGDIAESIKKYNAGYICNTVEEIEGVIADQFKKHFSKDYTRISRTPEELYDLSRESQQKKLEDLIGTMFNPYQVNI